MSHWNRRATRYPCRATVGSTDESQASVAKQTAHPVRHWTQAAATGGSTCGCGVCVFFCSLLLPDSTVHKTIITGAQGTCVRLVERDLTSAIHFVQSLRILFNLNRLPWAAWVPLLPPPTSPPCPLPLLPLCLATTHHPRCLPLPHNKACHHRIQVRRRVFSVTKGRAVCQSSEFEHVNKINSSNRTCFLASPVSKIAKTYC